MASYPGSIWSSGTNTDNVTPIDKTYMDNRDGEITAIEQALGIGLVPSNGAVHLVDRVKIGDSPQYNLILANNGGKVCIGPEDPGGPVANLDIYVSGTDDRSIRVSNTQRGLMIRAAGENNIPTVESKGGECLQFRAGNGNNTHYLFTSSGNFGIGTTFTAAPTQIPTAKLHVKSHTMRLEGSQSVTSPTDPPTGGNEGDITWTRAGSSDLVLWVKVSMTSWKRVQLV